MNSRTLAVLVLLVVALAAAVWISEASEDPACPPVMDVCLFVNSAADTDQRDSVLTLREAIRVTSGALPITTLTEPEVGQVVADSPALLGGCTSIYFDQAVFSATAAPSPIMVDPGGLPDLEPPSGGGGSEPDPPDSVGGASAPDYVCSAWPAASIDVGAAGAYPVFIGGGYLAGEGDVPANVVIDGTQLALGVLPLRVSRPVWLRGVEFVNVPGPAVGTAPDFRGFVVAAGTASE